ncbi:hypothetical protein B0H19DRAFT_1257606 [Mycena capillaripes]|nr:hypothetical protein B0H19DRAFT_1257606 [Mycena capillaripes]
MPDPPPPISPFRGRQATVTQPAVVPFDSSLFKRPYPAGDYLIVRGIYVPDNPKDGPLDSLNQRIAEIRAQTTGDLKNTHLVTTSLARKEKHSTSCSIRLDPIHTPENGEPRVDLLENWATVLRDASPFWEICWAPQADGRDKHMWVRVNEVFAKEGEKMKRDPDDPQVISDLRKGVDAAGFQTMDAFRLGTSKHTMLVLAKPLDVDTLLRKGSIKIPGFARELHVWSGGRQIEVRVPFEIIVGGFLANEDTGALEACRSWFAKFLCNGQSLLVETRVDPSEPDFVIFTMLDWAATADVLSDTDDFQSCLATQFNLTDPTLLYRFNSGPNKPSIHATVNAGADMIKDAIAAVHRRIDASERDARARDADMKAHLVSIDNTLTTVVAAAKELSQRQLDTSRAMFIMQQEGTLNLELARIDTDEYHARREFTYPVNPAEKTAAKAKIAALKTQRTEVVAKLDTLCGSGTLLMPPGPVIPPPSLPPTTPAPNKRPRTSTSGPDPDASDPNGRQPAGSSTDTDNDVPMVPASVRPIPCPSRFHLMAARLDAQGGRRMNPPCLAHRFTKGPDGTRGFSERRKLRGVLSVESSRHVVFLADTRPPVITKPRSNALIFLALFLFLSCIQVVTAATSPFTIYALNTNGFVQSTKVYHVNAAIKAQNPHAFVLSESKTNTRTSQTLPDDYNVFEEPGVRTENHHLYKWGIILGIRKNLQVAQRVAIVNATLRGRVVAVDIVLPTNDGRGFLHRIIGAYAPWDPGSPEGRRFWTTLTTFVNTTTTSWSMAGDLNTSASAIDRPSDSARDRAPLLTFLNAVNGHDIWRNHPDRTRDNDWTSGATANSTTGNIIDRVVTSTRQYIDADISTLDRHQSFVPHTTHRAVFARIIYSPPSGSASTIFPTHHTTLNKARIKYPLRTEKHRHVYERFTAIMVPAAEKAYGHITRYARRIDDRVSTPKIEKLVARLRFTGGAIRSIRNANSPPMSFGTLTAFNRILSDYYALPNTDLTLPQFATLVKRKIHRDIYAARAAEIQAERNATIARALQMLSVADLPNDFDPARVKEITRDYWSNLYQHDEPPPLAKPWITTPSVLLIKQQIANDPFLWPRTASLADFRALLRKGTPCQGNPRPDPHPTPFRPL